MFELRLDVTLFRGQECAITTLTRISEARIANKTLFAYNRHVHANSKKQWSGERQTKHGSIGRYLE